MLTGSVLNRAHLDQILRVMDSRTNFLGVPTDELELHDRISRQNLTDLLDPNYQSLGRLFGTVKLSADSAILQAVVFTLVSPTQPCFYVNKAYTLPDSEQQVLLPALEEIITHYEQLGYKRFYIMYPDEKVDVYRRMWRNSRLMADYSSYEDLRVEPNIRVKHSEFWELLFGRTLYTSTMIVRGFVKLDKDI